MRTPDYIIQNEVLINKILCLSLWGIWENRRLYSWAVARGLFVVGVVAMGVVVWVCGLGGGEGREGGERGGDLNTVLVVGAVVVVVHIVD